MMTPQLNGIIVRTLEYCEFVWPRRFVPLRIMLSMRWGKPLDLAAARQLSKYAPYNYAAQLAAGKAFLFGSGHIVSVIVEAERCFRRALEKSPRSVEATTYLAWSIDNQGRWTEAKGLYEQALAIDPTFGLAQERYAVALEERNAVAESPAISMRKTIAFSRFPETIGSLSNLESAIWNNVLSHVPKKALSLTRDSRIVTIGSCFAANLAHALKAEGVTATNLTVGEAINSTYANLEFLKWALGASPSVSEEMLRKFSKDEVSPLLTNADLIIYTLGVALCFFDKATGKFILPQKSEGVRGILKDKYVFRMTTVDENYNNLISIVSSVRRANPNCKFFFSLSPVPLTSTLEQRTAIEADCLSKAILRVAVDQVVSSTPGCFYWPAFEIVRWMGAYIPNMYGEEDGTTHHVSERVVRLIMKLFLQLYLPASKKEIPSVSVGPSGII